MFKLNRRVITGAVLIFGIIFAGGMWLHTQPKKVTDDVPGWSWVLGGRIITLDAGHGGVDPGAIGVNNTLEKDINLEISKRLQMLFNQAGSRVIMLREDDRDFGTSSKLFQRKREDLAFRIETAKQSNADVYLSIHANSFQDPRQNGPQVFYHPDSEDGKRLAENLQDSLNKVGTKKREAKANQSYFILKNSDMVAVTIEVGFLSNAQEEIRLNQAEYQQRLSMAIFEGVGTWLAAEKSVVSDD